MRNLPRRLAAWIAAPLWQLVEARWLFHWASYAHPWLLVSSSVVWPGQWASPETVTWPTESPLQTDRATSWGFGNRAQAPFLKFGVLNDPTEETTS